MKKGNMLFRFLNSKEFFYSMMIALGLVVISTLLMPLFISSRVIIPWQMMAVIGYTVILVMMGIFFLLPPFLLIYARLDRIAGNRFMAKQKKLYAKMLSFLPGSVFVYLIGSSPLGERIGFFENIWYALTFVTIGPVVGYYYSRAVASILRKIFGLRRI